MKTYTHPTITLPCGSVVVKFYDDSGSGSETTPDIIVENGIGDVTEGFDITLGEFRVSDCELILHNKDNYVLGTLLAVPQLRVSILINGQNYLYGFVDFGSIPTDNNGVDPDADLKYSHIRIKLINILGRLKDRTIANAKANMITGGPVSGSWTNYYYLNEFFRGIAFMAKCAYGSTDVDYVAQRKFNFTDSGTGAASVYLKDLIIKDSYFDTFDTSGLENNYEDNCSDALNLLQAFLIDFFLFPQIIYRDSDFHLKLIEKDNDNTITLPPIKKRELEIRYILRSLYVALKNISATLPVNTYLFDLSRKTFPEATWGDDINFYNLHTNITDEDSSTATAGGSLTTSASTMSVARTDFLDDSGDAKINGNLFHYTGKTGTTLTGCTVDSGTVVYSNGDKLERADHTYQTNLMLHILDSVFGPVLSFSEVENIDAFTDPSFHIAIKDAIKSVFYDGIQWKRFVVQGLVADGSMDNLCPGYKFTDNGSSYYIHQVTKSAVKNEAELLALKL